jgi:hypothetical protein
MAVKDRYQNNLRVNDRVKDLRESEMGEGMVVGTYAPNAIVKWDSGEEETVRASDLVLASQRLGGRRTR